MAVAFVIRFLRALVQIFLRANQWMGSSIAKICTVEIIFVFKMGVSDVFIFIRSASIWGSCCVTSHFEYHTKDKTDGAIWWNIVSMQRSKIAPTQNNGCQRFCFWDTRTYFWNVLLLFYTLLLLSFTSRLRRSLSIDLVEHIGRNSLVVQ